MRSHDPHRLRQTRACVVVLVVAALAMSACAPTADPADVSDFEQPPGDIVTDPASLAAFEQALADIATDPATRRPTFALTTETPGEWVGGRALEAPNPNVLSFVATDDGPRAVILKKRWPEWWLGVFAPVDDNWRLASDWSWFKDSPYSSSDVASYVAIGTEVLAVGPNHPSPADQPWSFVVGATPAIPSPATEEAGRVAIHKAVAGNGAVMAIGRRNGKATAWLSTDGRDWDTVSLPVAGAHRLNYLDLMYAGDRWTIVAKHTATKSDPQQLVVMTSSDGDTWQPTILEPPLVGDESLQRVVVWDEADLQASLRVVLAHDGSTWQVLANGLSGGASVSVTWASADGTTWGSPLPIAVGTFDRHRGKSQAKTFDSTVLVGQAGHRLDSRYCFETDQPCDSRLDALWVPDGDAWSLLVPPDIPLPQAAAIIDDVLYVGGQDEPEAGIAMYQWSPAVGSTLPHAAPLDVSPPRMTLPLATTDPLERGDVLAAALSLDLHEGRAGINCKPFDGRTWALSAVAPGAIEIVRESGAVADTILFGTIELVDRDLIEFAVPGYGPVAYLEPRSTDESDKPCSGSSNL